ncbi:MAG: hypothetical protein Q8M31_04045 [Beijerinckiaceae bacterium]|nr:hypothetical protein [Beijerinckiaceae bacterium]
MSELRNDIELESRICDLAIMASIASKLVDDVQLEDVPGRGKGAFVDEDDLNVMLFAIYDVEIRAKALKVAYYGC